MPRFTLRRMMKRKLLLMLLNQLPLLNQLLLLLPNQLLLMLLNQLQLLISVLLLSTLVRVLLKLTSMLVLLVILVMKFGIKVVKTVLPSMKTVPSLVHSRSLRITYVVPVFPSTVLKPMMKLVIYMLTSSLLNKILKMLTTLTLVFTVGVVNHLLNTMLLITGSVNTVQVIGLEKRSTVISLLMELNTLFMKTLVSVHPLMVKPLSNNSSLFVRKLVTVVPLILLLTLRSGKNLVWF